MELWTDFLLLLDSTLRLATPLIFCALAGVISERAGVVDIGLEGKLLASAFAAAGLRGAVRIALGRPWRGAPRLGRALGGARLRLHHP